VLNDCGVQKEVIRLNRELLAMRELLAGADYIGSFPTSNKQVEMSLLAVGSDKIISLVIDHSRSIGADAPLRVKDRQEGTATVLFGTRKGPVRCKLLAGDAPEFKEEPRKRECVLTCRNYGVNEAIILEFSE
jgi:hypothetical protein